MEKYLLINPSLENEWKRYHDLRREILFEDRGRFGVYNENHPDEYKNGNHPFLLLYDDKAVGTVRIDFYNKDIAILRLVTIDKTEQGKGHGRKLLELVEDFARKNKKSILATNAANESIGYYYSFGFEKSTWSKSEINFSKYTQLIKKI